LIAKKPPRVTGKCWSPGKRGFTTFREALFSSRLALELFVYACPCGQLHLTSKDKGKSTRRMSEIAAELNITDLKGTPWTTSTSLGPR
jgi:hypothetical protein